MGKVNKRLKTATAVVEPKAYVEIGGYVHQNQGRADVALYVGEKNQPLKIDDAEITKRLKKIRVTMNVEEDTGVYNNQVYRKAVSMDQEVVEDGNDPAPVSSKTSASPNFNTIQNPGTGLDKADYLKNIRDTDVAENGREHKQFPWLWVLGAVALAIAAAGLAIALIR